jgi:hypothetical protein
MLVVMKSSVFWDIMPYNPLKVLRHFGGTFFLRLYGSRIICAINHCESRWRRYLPPKHWLTFNELHGIISQKIEPFIP